MKIAKEVCVILCDDIRHESGNKVSLMGVYNKNILISEFPKILPKICFFVMIHELNNEIEKIDVRIKMPGMDELKFESAAPVKPDSIAAAAHNIAMELVPFRIKDVGESKLSIYVNEEKKPSFTYKFNILLQQKQKSKSNK